MKTIASFGIKIQEYFFAFDGMITAFLMMREIIMRVGVFNENVVKRDKFRFGFRKKFMFRS